MLFKNDENNYYRNLKVLAKNKIIGSKIEIFKLFKEI